MKSKIYIAGPITNNPDYKEDFSKAEKHLKESGFYTVLNPAALPAGLTQEEYMRICIPMLQICDSVIMLQGWEDSVGAKIEYQLAKQAGKEIYSWVGGLVYDIKEEK